jgi:DNA-binding NarL/FixJ family response regulator
MIRVLVADDQDAVRSAFVALIDAEDDMEVVAEAADGRTAVERARATSPRVVIMDVRMPVLDGVEATREIRSDGALLRTRVLVVTTFDLDDHVYGALRAGASGFLLKDVEPDELLRGIRIVAAGDALLAPGITRRMLAEFTSRPAAPREPRSPAVDALTTREREVVRQVARGLTNLEIAAALVISPLTVKTHVSNALVKLGCRDRAHLVSLAYEQQIIRPGEY